MPLITIHATLKNFWVVDTFFHNFHRLSSVSKNFLLKQSTKKRPNWLLSLLKGSSVHQILLQNFRHFSFPSLFFQVGHDCDLCRCHVMLFVFPYFILFWYLRATCTFSFAYIYISICFLYFLSFSMGDGVFFLSFSLRY